MTEDQSLLKFPCDFPLKIIGEYKENFFNEVVEIIRKHFPKTADESIRAQESKKGNYLAISVTVYVQEKNTLDALYLELTQYPPIKMVL